MSFDLSDGEHFDDSNWDDEKFKKQIKSSLREKLSGDKGKRISINSKSNASPIIIFHSNYESPYSM